MLINNNYIQIPDEGGDIYRQAPNSFEENEFINNLMLNPGKYRDFKRNINRINNIENEINYLKSIEKKNQIDFVSNIKISEEEYENALNDAEIIFENINEEQISDLLSHKKLLSNEKHLIETMVYFFGNENFDWNTFKISFSLYEAKTKMKNVDYSKIRKRKINILLGQLCRSDKMNNFLSMNDFCDSGMEFVYEWVKCQLKIYFYLFQNKKIPKIKVSKSMLDIYKSNYKFEKKTNKANDNENKNNFDDKITNNTGITNYNNSSNCNQNITQQKIIESIIPKSSTNVETLNNTNYIKSNNITNIIYPNTINNTKNSEYQKRNNSLNYKNNKISKSTIENNTLLLTSLPYIIIGKENDQNKDIKHSGNTGETTQQININKYKKANRIFKPKKFI